MNTQKLPDAVYLTTRIDGGVDGVYLDIPPNKDDSSRDYHEYVRKDSQPKAAMNIDETRAAFEEWLEAPDQNYKDQASIYWSAFAAGSKHATAAAEEKYLVGVISTQTAALKAAKNLILELRTKWGRGNEPLPKYIDNSIALAAPLLGEIK
jgi:hypothetical protein